MNFKTTSFLLEAIKPYTEKAKITISDDINDIRGQTYKTDYVSIDKNHNVGFNVSDNEITVFYFTDHYHFNDYICEPEKDEDNYIERAKNFLLKLFQYKIRHIEYYKGKILSSEKYFIIYNDRDDELLTTTCLNFLSAINPFAKKTSHSTTWHYNESKGIFTNKPTRSINPEAVEVVDVSEDCYIEIFEYNNCYSYIIMEIDFDDYYGEFFWAPSLDIIPSGIYDTKEKAISYAIDAIKSGRC